MEVKARRNIRSSLCCQKEKVASTELGISVDEIDAFEKGCCVGEKQGEKFDNRVKRRCQKTMLPKTGPGGARAMMCSV